MSLEFLDFLFQVHLILLLLVLLSRRIDLVPYLIEDLDTFLDFLQSPIDLRLKFPVRAHLAARADGVALPALA